MGLEGLLVAVFAPLTIFTARFFLNRRVKPGS
jgi:hypothetical protein